MAQSPQVLKLDWTGGDQGRWRIEFPDGEFITAREVILRVTSRLETLTLTSPDRLHGYLFCEGTVIQENGNTIII